MYKRCYSECGYVTLRLWELQLQGAVTDSQGQGVPRKPGKKCGRDSSPELILLVLLLVPHKRDTEVESKAQPLVLKDSSLGQWLMCLFSTDMTIRVTQLLVHVVYA